MLKAIHAGEDIEAAREKAVRVIEKLHALRLTKAAELVEAAAEETLTYYALQEEHWRASEPTICLSASYARLGDVPVLLAGLRTGNRRSTLPRPGCAISPAPHGRPNAI